MSSCSHSGFSWQFTTLLVIPPGEMGEGCRSCSRSASVSSAAGVSMPGLLEGNVEILELQNSQHPSSGLAKIKIKKRKSKSAFCRSLLLGTSGVLPVKLPCKFSGEMQHSSGIASWCWVLQVHQVHRPFAERTTGNRSFTVEARSADSS